MVRGVMKAGVIGISKGGQQRIGEGCLTVGKIDI